MTQLYRLDCPAAQIAAHFDAQLGEDPWSGGYLAPEKFAPVITAGREFIAGPRPARGPLKPRLVPRLWGVSPPASAANLSRRVVSVRNPDRPFWVGNLRNCEFRCLVPATRFMLWGSETDYEGRRLQHWFAPDGEKLFAMAGVWKDEEVPGFAVLTRDATGRAKQLGARTMPIVLANSPAAREAWLHAGWDTARRHIAPNAAPALIELDRG